MTALRELSLRLVWSHQAQEGDADLMLSFLPGRSRVLSVRRTSPAGGAGPPEPLPEDGASIAPAGAGRPSRGHRVWRLPITPRERDGGELVVTVSYRLAPPVVAGVLVVPRGAQVRLPGGAQGHLVARMNARRLAASRLDGELRSTFEWFTEFERRSNDALMEAGGGALGGRSRADVMGAINGCRADLLARLRARAEQALCRRLVPRLLRSARFGELAASTLLEAPLGREGRRRWKRGLRALGRAYADQPDLAPLARRECRDRLRFVRDHILEDASDGTGPGGWRALEVEEIGRRFQRFAQGGMRLHDQLHELSAEPDSCFFFLFAEMAIALSELPVAGEELEGEPVQTPADRLRWRELAREFVVCEQLFRRAYAPGPSLLVRDFDAYHRANMDRDPRRRTSPDELARLRSIYAALDPGDPDGWRRILADHALLVSLTCPGWLRPWKELSGDTRRALGGVTVAAAQGDGARGDSQTVRLFVRHVISAFVDLPQGPPVGSRTLAELKLTGEPLGHLAESLRGYVRRRSGGLATVTRRDLQDKTVEQVLQLVVDRCAVPETRPGEGGDEDADQPPEP